MSRLPLTNTEADAAEDARLDAYPDDVPTENDERED